MKSNNKIIYKKAHNFEKKCLNYLNKFYFKKIARNISDNDRITVSSRDFDISKFVISTDEEFPSRNKPDGLYYAFGRQWIDHMSIENGNVYLLDINLSKIYKLTNNNLSEFIKKYCNKVTQEQAFQKMFMFRQEFPIGFVIDWDKFKKQYDGIEVPDLLSLKQEFKKSFPKDHMSFLDYFDINGGVFWKKNVLTTATKIATIEDGQIKELQEPINYQLSDKAETFTKYYNEETGEKSYKPAKPEYFSESSYYEIIHQLRDQGDNLSNLSFEAYKKYMKPSEYFWSLHEAFKTGGFDGLYEKVKEILMNNMDEKTYYSPELNIDEIIKELFVKDMRYDVVANYAAKQNMSKEQIKELLQEIFLNLNDDQLEKMSKPIIFRVWQESQ